MTEQQFVNCTLYQVIIYLPKKILLLEKDSKKMLYPVLTHLRIQAGKFFMMIQSHPRQLLLAKPLIPHIFWLRLKMGLRLYRYVPCATKIHHFVVKLMCARWHCVFHHVFDPTMRLLAKMVIMFLYLKITYCINFDICRPDL